jgi:hypothetical protein
MRLNLLSARWLCLLAAVLGCWMNTPTASAQEVVYIKRSELWAYELGQQAQQGAQAVNEFNGHMAKRAADYRRLDELKKRVSACGNCADRQRLEQQAGELEARLTFFDRMLCGTFEVTRSIGPSSGVISKLLGVDTICRSLRLPLQPDQNFIAAQRKRIEAGELDGYAAIGMHYISGLQDGTNYWSDRANAGCPFLYRGSQLGDPESLYRYMSSCMQRERSTLEERTEGTAMLKRCAAREVPGCLHWLGHMNSEEGGFMNGTMSANNQEALRLWDLAASKGYAASANEAKRLRNRMQGIAEPPPAQAKSVPLPPKQLRTGTYRVFAGGMYEGVCIVAALGGDRYSFDWRLQSRNSRTPAPPDRKLESQVEGTTITFNVDGQYRTYNVLVDTGNNFVLLFTGQPRGEKLTWEGSTVALAAPVAAQETTQEKAESDSEVAAAAPTPRCRRAQQYLQDLRERGQRDARYAARLERAEQKYQESCGSR